MTAVIPDNVKKVFNENLWYIAAFGDEPNVVPVGFKRVCDDGKLAIGAVLLETIECSVICFAVMLITHCRVISALITRDKMPGSDKCPRKCCKH